MTDEKPTGPLRATVCDVEDCRALIPATKEDRIAHRRGHTHQDKVVEGWRNALKSANAKIDRLTGRVSTLETDVEHIEIPEPVDPFAIVDAADLEPLPVEEDDEDDVDVWTAAPIPEELDDEDEYDEPTRVTP